MATWKVAAAATVGERHVADGRDCEDAWISRAFVAGGEPWLVLAVADGAGSAGRAAAGSALAVTAFAEAVVQAVTPDAGIDERTLRRCLSAVRALLDQEAAREGRPVRDYASTLLAAVIGPRLAAFVQIGDGAIVVAGDEPGEWGWMFESGKGEYANETSFVSDADASETANIAILDHVPNEIALFSDGLENLLIRLSPTRQVVGAFFDQMFPPVRRSVGVGLNAELGSHLSAYLASTAIAARTDDDRTLILATRLSESAPESVTRESEPCATL